jgi:hypothetical protein
MGVAAVGGIMSLLTLGFLTSSGSVPGDWNYTLKRANERIQYTLSPRDSRLNLQIDHTETRIRDLQVRTLRGQVSPGDIQRLEQEARDLTELVKAQGQPLEEAQKAKVKVIVDTGTAVLDDAKAKKADLEPSTASATTQLQEVYAAAVGPVTPIKSSPTAAPSSTATSAATATATATAASSPTPAPPTSATEAKPTETKPAETKPPATPDPSPASTAGAAQTTTPPATSTP